MVIRLSYAAFKGEDKWHHVICTFEERNLKDIDYNLVVKKLS